MMRLLFALALLFGCSAPVTEHDAAVPDAAARRCTEDSQCPSGSCNRVEPFPFGLCRELDAPTLDADAPLEVGAPDDAPPVDAGPPDVGTDAWIECGFRAEPCCAGGVCYPGLVCSSGVCTVGS